MNLFKKVFILFIIILFSFIFYRLLNQRKMILTDIQRTQTHIEGMNNADPFYNKVIKDIQNVSIANKLPPFVAENCLIQNAKTSLNQFCIKGSFNSAFSGNYISDEMIKYVLSRGCRFLDFQVFYLPDESNVLTPYVGFSKNVSNYNSSDSKNTMKFSDILGSTILNAFTKYTTQQYKTTNVEDPLFIHIRMNTDAKHIQELYDAIQRNIEINTALTPYNYLYNNKSIPVDKNTKFKDIQSKVIYVFEYNNIFNNGKNIGKYHNMSSNTKDIMRSFYSEINISKYKTTPLKQKTGNITNATTFKMLMPDNNTSSIQSNPDIYTAIQKYGIQVSLLQYYVTDMNLLKYENMFQSYNAGIIPMTNSLNFIENYYTSDDNNANVIFPKLFS